MTGRSSIWRTAPIDAAGPDFLNAVVRLTTSSSPEALLAALMSIEACFGRERPYPNAPRVLDLDLLLLGETVRESAALTLPHPGLTSGPSFSHRWSNLSRHSPSARMAVPRHCWRAASTSASSGSVPCAHRAQAPRMMPA
jgi:2-amino-4-hydroxy-6-hydroxymethyldihydropteridine diphosphokinase